VLIGAGMLVGFLVARIHLWTFDKWFLKRGAVARLARDAKRR